nr:hypothetical protein [Haliscomenobacter sp.]
MATESNEAADEAVVVGVFWRFVAGEKQAKRKAEEQQILHF